MITETTETALEAALFRLYEQWWHECGYRAERFRQTIVPKCKNYKGGIAAARAVVHRRTTVGFSALRQKNRLDLTVEALVLEKPWSDLFSDEDKRIAREKLARFSE
jgi:hypothetical protein